MISRILRLAHTLQSAQATRHFNATLPILLQVLEKTRGGYRLRFGEQIIEAKSHQSLQIGAKYWARMRESSVGETLISGLIKQPRIFESALNTTMTLNLSEIVESLKSGEFMRNLKDYALDSALHAQNREDFSFANNTLLALQNGIINLVIADKSKRALLQIKKPKDEHVEFCAIFSNLGILNGTLYGLKTLVILTQHPNVQTFLENNVRYLRDYEEFESVKILLNDDARVFYELREENLLDLEV